MAHQMLKAYSFLFYFLGIIVAFFIGMTYAGIVEAGKNQGLAGGAIVFGYGVIAAFLGLIITLFIAHKTNRKLIFRLNIILALCIAGFYAYYHIKYQERQKAKAQEKQITEEPKQQTSVVSDAYPVAEPTALLFTKEKDLQTNKPSGLGIFSPHLNEKSTLYFYSNPNLKKSIQEHIPLDSITFIKSKYGMMDISTAPPWLVPDHLKLDYDILYFRVQSVTSDYYEIIVNTITNQTSFVNKNSGIIQYWPEFLLSINSVEFLNPNTQNVYIKPLENASIIKTTFSFMKPIRIQSNWMYVELLDDNITVLGSGWIKWRNNDRLLIRYSILS